MKESSQELIDEIVKELGEYRRSEREYTIMTWSPKVKEEWDRAFEEEVRKHFKSKKQKLYKYDNNDDNSTKAYMCETGANKKNETRAERRRNKRNSLRKGFRR